MRGRRDDYFSGWLHTSDIESFVSGQSMQYGTDLDVTNYVNKRRVTFNPAPPPPPPVSGKTGAGGRKRSAASAADGADAPPATDGGAVVTPKFVWEKFRQGCSLRMPCPQKYSDPLHRLLSALEEEFGCMVGSNVYLTPPRNQGFAPHWDDIEAFLLQVRDGEELEERCVVFLGGWRFGEQRDLLYVCSAVLCFVCMLYDATGMVCRVAWVYVWGYFCIS